MTTRIEIFADRQQAEISVLALNTNGWATRLDKYERMSVIDATAAAPDIVYAGNDRWVVTATR